MAVMSFFDDVQPGEPEPPREHHPWDPPEAEFPGAVPFSTLILGRTERAAVAVTGLSAYSAGFEIFVTARVRPDGDPDAGPGGGMPPPGRAPGGARRSFRFGLQFADGSKVIGQHGGPGRHAGPGPDPAAGRRPIRGRSWRAGAPLLLLAVVGLAAPPAGPVEFVCEWPALGIPESRAGLDGQLLLDAAARSIRLWPEDGG